MTELQAEPDGRRDGSQIVAVLYAAKSTEDVHGSIPTQLDDTRAAAEREGRLVVFEDRDEAASAYSGNRGDGLKRAFAAAEDAAAEHGTAELWVQHSDRLARGDGIQAKHLVEHLLWAWNANVVLRSVQDDRTFDDLVRSAFMGERNHEDSARRSAATRAGLLRTAQRGEWAGGLVPDGYAVQRAFDDHGRVTRTIVIDSARVEVPRLMFELAAAGHSTHAIVLALDDRGWKTNPRRRDRKAAPYRANTVGQVLANAFYAGMRVHKGVIVGPGQWPAIVDLETFERTRVDRRARSSADKRPKVGRPPEGFLLARVATCGACGSEMDVRAGGYVRVDGTSKKTYTCRLHCERPQDCSAAPIDAGVVDGAVVANLTSWIGDVAGWHDRLVASREATQDRMLREVGRSRDDIQRAEKVLEKSHRSYVAAMAADDDLKAAAIEDVLVQQRQERARAQTVLEAAQTAFEDAGEGPGFDELLDFYAGLSSELAGRVKSARGNVKRMNLLVQDYFERVELTQEEGGVRVLPVLSAAAVERIRLEHWQHVRAIVMSADGRVLLDDVPVRAGLDDEGELHRLVYEEALTRAPLVEGEEVVIALKISRPPATLATGRETIEAPMSPPMRPIVAHPDENVSAPSCTDVPARAVTLPEFVAVEGGR